MSCPPRPSWTFTSSGIRTTRPASMCFERIHAHFHSEGYSGLAGGAVEVYARSLGWSAPEGRRARCCCPGRGRSADARAIQRDRARSRRRAEGCGPARPGLGRLPAPDRRSVSDTIAVLPVTVPGVNLTDSASSRHRLPSNDFRRTALATPPGCSSGASPRPSRRRPLG